jgi:hypothetical protein
MLLAVTMAVLLLAVAGVAADGNPPLISLDLDEDPMLLHSLISPQSLALCRKEEQWQELLHGWWLRDHRY